MNERDYIINQLIKEKGGTKEDYERIMNSIAYHESAHTLDPTIKQIGGGPGRGKYQFELGTNQGAITAARRTKQYYDKLNKPVPKWLKDATSDKSLDASNLTSSQQDILFLGNMKMHPKADFANIIEGKESIPEFWAKYHWAGKASDYDKRIDSFNKSFESFKHKQPQQLKTEVESNPELFKKSYYSDDVVNQMHQVRDNTQYEEPTIQNHQWLAESQQRDMLQQQLEQQAIQEQQQAPQPRPQPRGPIDPNTGMDQLMRFITQRRNQANQPGPQLQSADKELTRYNGGGTHEQNPLGGIPIGNNSVEAPETSFNLPSGKFVFSDRIGLDGMQLGANQNVSNSYNNQFAYGGNINSIQSLPSYIMQNKSKKRKK